MIHAQFSEQLCKRLLIIKMLMKHVLSGTKRHRNENLITACY